MYYLEVEANLFGGNKTFQSYSNEDINKILQKIDNVIGQWKNYYKKIIIRNENNGFYRSFQQSDLSRLKEMSRFKINKIEEFDKYYRMITFS